VSYATHRTVAGHNATNRWRAELYVQSDKLAKRARFVMDSARADAWSTRWCCRTAGQPQGDARALPVARQPRQVPEAWLNPMFLARNPALE
jgi:hypothetical protein